LPEIKTALDNAFVRHRRRGRPADQQRASRLCV